ncbi:hypothetical protein Taro_006882, partial [Colocasia esculenta]|nr:hypothetical protein [Colocasia esculenta]
LEDQLASIQDAIDVYPQLDVVWQPYLEEVDEGQLWLELAHPYFGRTVWVDALNLVLPLHLYLTQRSLGHRQCEVEFPSRGRTPRPGRRFQGLHDTTYWREFALKYGAKVYRGARRQVDVTGEIASLRALLHSPGQDREVARREVEQLAETSAVEVGRLRTQVEELTRELALLHTQGPTADQAELTLPRTELVV